MCHDLWNQSVGDKKSPHTPFAPPRTATIQLFYLRAAALSVIFSNLHQPSLIHAHSPRHDSSPCQHHEFPRRYAERLCPVPPMLSFSFFFFFALRSLTLHLTGSEGKRKSKRVRRQTQRPEGFVDSGDISSDTDDGLNKQRLPKTSRSSRKAEARSARTSHSEMTPLGSFLLQLCSFFRLFFFPHFPFFFFVACFLFLFVWNDLRPLCLRQRLPQA